MFYGLLEIDTINDNGTITFKNGKIISIKEKTKRLFTETSITASELQEKSTKMIASDLLEVLNENDVRLADMNSIMNILNQIIDEKNQTKVASLFGKDNLDILSAVYGSDKGLVDLAIRNIRMSDIL